jgi:hypothetical protein
VLHIENPYIPRKEVCDHIERKISLFFAERFLSIYLVKKISDDVGFSDGAAN